MVADQSQLGSAQHAAASSRRLGLRARVVLSFAIGALLLSTLLSVVTYQLTRANLLDQRIEDVRASAIRTAQDINAELGRAANEAANRDGALGTPTPEAEQALAERIMNQFDAPWGSTQALRVGSYFWSEFGFEEIDLPTPLAEQAFPSTADSYSSAVEMVFDGSAGSSYALVLPLPYAQVSSSYIQSASLADIEDTLSNLRTTLVGASAVTAILGLAFGVYVASRLFDPLSDISAAAASIAEGDLSTRLEHANDPDLDQLVSSFNGMTSSLQQRIERDSRFASDVSHELRSPLMTLTGSAAVLEKRRDEIPERAQLALDLLTADIRRFKQLVEDLLEISRFDVGAIELDKSEVLLTEFVSQAMHAATNGARQVPVTHGDDAKDLIALIDKRRVAQVVRNLSENADKYAGGVTQARIDRLGTDGVRISLEDRGPGVPEAEREVIFERFARGSEGGRRGSGTGVGLGLSLVVEHLRLHGGTIAVTDRSDGEQGARFVIDLPGVVIDE